MLNSFNGIINSHISFNYPIKKFDILKNDYLLVSGSNFIEIWDVYSRQQVQRFNDFKAKIINILDVVELADRNLAVYDSEQVYIKEIGKLLI